ncbi:uncharacterized protein rpgra [Salminus brasiliensis]|uniref:uncharacterized protein rpgra n=1 Tax=Salminus brasiliensis TaxID=930266 RepID=UPI003B834260
MLLNIYGMQLLLNATENATEYQFSADSGAVFTFGKSKIADSVPSKFWLKNDKPVHISCGHSHSAFVTEQGRLFVFGNNNSGQLGLESKGPITKPVCVKALKNERIQFTACGNNHTLVSTSQGDIYAAGGNSEGQLGLGHCDDRTSFQQLHPFYDHGPIRLLSAGCNTSAALTVDGRLFMWGDNSDGQLGLGSENHVLFPQELKVDHPIAGISCGYSHSALITDIGDVFTFGKCADGRLGLSADQLANHRQPQRVGTLKGVLQVACGGTHTLALTENELYSFGHGEFGQLGLGTFVFQADLPAAVGHFRKGRVSHVTCGENHTALITDGGLLYTFGNGHHGKLGLGDENFTNQFTPTVCQRFFNYTVMAVACGSSHMLVFARLRCQESAEVCLEDEDVTYSYLDRCYTSMLLGQPLEDIPEPTFTPVTQPVILPISLPASHRWSLSARCRRRQRQDSSHKTSFLLHQPQEHAYKPTTSPAKMDPQIQLLIMALATFTVLQEHFQQPTHRDDKMARLPSKGQADIRKGMIKGKKRKHIKDIHQNEGRQKKLISVNPNPTETNILTTKSPSYSLLSTASLHTTQGEDIGEKTKVKGITKGKLQDGKNPGIKCETRDKESTKEVNIKEMQNVKSTSSSNGILFTDYNQLMITDKNQAKCQSSSINGSTPTITHSDKFKDKSHLPLHKKKLVCKAPLKHSVKESKLITDNGQMDINQQTEKRLTLKTAGSVLSTLALASSVPLLNEAAQRAISNEPQSAPSRVSGTAKRVDSSSSVSLPQDINTCKHVKEKKNNEVEGNTEHFVGGEKEDENHKAGENQNVSEFSKKRVKEDTVDSSEGEIDGKIDYNENYGLNLESEKEGLKKRQSEDKNGEGLSGDEGVEEMESEDAEYGAEVNEEQSEAGNEEANESEGDKESDAEMSDSENEVEEQEEGLIKVEESEDEHEEKSEAVEKMKGVEESDSEESCAGKQKKDYQTEPSGEEEEKEEQNKDEAEEASENEGEIEEWEVTEGKSGDEDQIEEEENNNEGESKVAKSKDDTEGSEEEENCEEEKEEVDDKADQDVKRSKEEDGAVEHDKEGEEESGEEEEETDEGEEGSDGTKTDEKDSRGENEGKDDEIEGEDEEEGAEREEEEEGIDEGEGEGDEAEGETQEEWEVEADEENDELKEDERDKDKAESEEEEEDEGDKEEENETKKEEKDIKNDNLVKNDEIEDEDDEEEEEEEIEEENEIKKGGGGNEGEDEGDITVGEEWEEESEEKNDELKEYERDKDEAEGEEEEKEGEREDENELKEEEGGDEGEGEAEEVNDKLKKDERDRKCDDAEDEEEEEGEQEEGKNSKEKKEDGHEDDERWEEGNEQEKCNGTTKEAEAEEEYEEEMEYEEKIDQTKNVEELEESEGIEEEEEDEQEIKEKEEDDEKEEEDVDEEEEEEKEEEEAEEEEEAIQKKESKAKSKAAPLDNKQAVKERYKGEKQNPQAERVTRAAQDTQFWNNVLPQYLDLK